MLGLDKEAWVSYKGLEEGFENCGGGVTEASGFREKQLQIRDGEKDFRIWPDLEQNCL